MKNIKSKLLLGAMGVAGIACAAVFCLCPMGSASATYGLSSERLTQSSHISYEIKDYDNLVNNNVVNSEDVTLVLPGDVEQTSYKRESFKWSDTKSVTFTVDTSSVGNDGQQHESFTYSYSLVWVPALVSEDKAPFNAAYAVEVKLVDGATVTDKDEIPTKLTIFLDDTNPSQANEYNTKTLFEEDYTDVTGQTYDSVGSWGLYLFSFTVDGQDEYSNVLEVKPEDVMSLDKPYISVTKIKSTKRLNTAYQFTLDDSYKFVDPQQIKWFVEGQSNDGRDWVLEESDKTEDTQNALYENYSRNGTSFILDPDYEGTWTVSCNIYQPDRTTKIEEFTATADPVSTVRGLSTQSIIWIVVAAAAAAGIIVAVVIIVSIKREKVY